MLRLVERSSGYLFASQELRGLLDQRGAAMRAEVEEMDANRLLNTAPADLARYLADKYALETPILHREGWSADQSEARIEIMRGGSRWEADPDSPSCTPGQRIEVEVPFDGDAELMYARASTCSLSVPRAKVRGQSLILLFELPHDSQRNIREETDHSLAEIETHLGWIRNDVNVFNGNLQVSAESCIASRRTRILANRERVASLGIPLKSRPDAPQTYASPVIRRKVVPSLPPASTVPFVPEPVLATEHYEEILSVIQNMALVMERSPSAFRTMREEDLRQHFLVQLNGRFEGKATGETFNVGGKTDILLRENGRNVFIAECKFWNGSKHFRETIDQLLGYTAWRDTKTAILVFNRGTALSNVLSGIRGEVERHPNYKRSVPWKHETGFRFVFHHIGDPNRELILTVLAFDVPEAS